MYHTVNHSEKSYMVDYIYDRPSQDVDLIAVLVFGSPIFFDNRRPRPRPNGTVPFLVHDVLVPKSRRPVLRRPDMVGRTCFGMQITTVESTLH